MSKTAASEDSLGTLHRLMTEQFTKLLNGELTRPTFNKDGERGEDEVIVATAAELSVIRAFLKDNEITASMEEGTALDQLRQKLAGAREGRPAMPASDFDMPPGVQ
jgi:hypothetical protein